MKWLSRIIYFLLPTLRIRPRWKDAWEQKEREAFTLGGRVLFVIGILSYLAHYFFIDRALHLEPEWLWTSYRLGCAALAALGFILTFVAPLAQGAYYRLPMFLICVIFSYLQARSMTWYSEVPYVYSIVLPTFCSILLRFSVVGTVFYLLGVFALQYPSWSTRPQELPYIISAAVVGLFAASVFRSRMTAEVAAFVSERENLEAQSRLIQTEMELNEQIRAFLPTEIYRRFDFLVREGKQTPLQAMDDVLRCRRTIVTCLYSDIRGFTQSTKNNNDFIDSAAVPNIRACTDIVENHNGIPRLIGDLVFSYFDRHPHVSLLEGVLCGFELAQQNAELNKTLSQIHQINRYVLVSYGDAVVGNIGGTEGSRDITVLGNPANILSRIDPITKDPRIKPFLSKKGVILTDEAAAVIRKIVADLELTPIEIHELNVEIRDFEEESRIWILHHHAMNEEKLRNAIEAYSELNHVPIFTHENDLEEGELAS